MIEVTGIDLAKFAQKVYELSVPRGLGFLHAKGGGLSDTDVASLIQNKGSVALSMDYVHGRGCKMNVFREGDKLFINDSWYDHTNDDLNRLLDSFGIVPPTPTDHGLACECQTCCEKRQNRN